MLAIRLAAQRLSSTKRVSQRREGVCVSILRQWPGVAALCVRQAGQVALFHPALMKRADHTAKFPMELATLTRGVLDLELSVLMVDDQEALKICRYATASGKGRPEASFHPDISQPPNPAKWQEIFDRRLAEFEKDWRSMMLRNEGVIARRIKDWLPSDVSAKALVESLQLKLILVSANESVTVRFETSPLLNYHDLGVTFDPRNQAKSVEIEG